MHFDINASFIDEEKSLWTLVELHKHQEKSLSITFISKVKNQVFLYVQKIKFATIFLTSFFLSSCFVAQRYISKYLYSLD